MMQSILLCSCLLPFFGCLFILSARFLGGKKYTYLLGLKISIFNFLISFFLIFNFNTLKSGFQFVSSFNILNSITVGLDGISLPFYITTTFIIPLCIMSINQEKTAHFDILVVCILLTQGILLFAFVTLNLLAFYILFESVLIPMFIIMNVWGTRPRRLKASYYLFIYTVIGSFFYLLVIILIAFEVGSFDYLTLVNTYFSLEREKLIWCCLFISFGIKIPLFPLHLWLPEAHVEAPTIGSVILASLLLKLGGYGFLRFLLPLAPKASIFFMPLSFLIAMIGGIYTAFTAIRQIDIKKIIAYSSISHMHIAVIGVCSGNFYAIQGGILLMIGHSIVSGAQFFLIGFLYERFGTKLIRYFSGLLSIMPLFSIFYLLFTFSSFNFPISAGFTGELLIFQGLFYVNPIVTLVSSVTIILGATYSIWLANRLLGGALSIHMYQPKLSNNSLDLNRKEFYIMVALSFINLVIGFYPSKVLGISEACVLNLITHIKTEIT